MCHQCCLANLSVVKLWTCFVDQPRSGSRSTGGQSGDLVPAGACPLGSRQCICFVDQPRCLGLTMLGPLAPPHILASGHDVAD